MMSLAGDLVILSSFMSHALDMFQTSTQFEYSRFSFGLSSTYLFSETTEMILVKFDPKSTLNSCTVQTTFAKS